MDEPDAEEEEEVKSPIKKRVRINSVIEAARSEAALPLPAPMPEMRRMPTRERVWREQLAAYDERRGPDPLTIHCLRKNGRRFQPGGLASQTGLSGGNATFAIANARLAYMANGVPSIRILPGLRHSPSMP